MQKEGLGDGKKLKKREIKREIKEVNYLYLLLSNMLLICL